jgi:hypothetical protein
VAPALRVFFHSLWIYTMNSCKLLRMSRAGAWSLALLAAALTAALSFNACAQTAERQFPKNAQRAVLVVTATPQITLDGIAERLSPGARIKGLSNTLVMSASLTGQPVLVNYVRDPQGMIHEVWILSDREAQDKRVGNTPVDQAPKPPAQ